MDLSVIIPIKDERDNLKPLLDQLRQTLDPLSISYEMLFVDDGSSDDSYALLTKLARTDERIKVVRLRRNFGQTAALRAGIDWSSGEVLVTMDGDLQNDPADIPVLLEQLSKGFDAVLGLRANRQDNYLIRKLPSWTANWIIRKVTGVQIKDLGCTLRAMRRDLAVALPLYGEMHRFVAVLAQQYGARLAQIPVRHHPRTAGKTKYGLTRTIRVVLDLITIKFMHSYLTRPMHVMGLCGMISMAAGVVSLLATVWMKSRSGVFMTGNPLLHLSVMLEFFGVQFFSIGLVGEVLTRTYFESQDKRSYTVRDTLNLDVAEKRRAA